MTPNDFGAWRARLGLTQAEAGEALGVDRRTIMRYEMGEREIPQAVGLATRQIEAERAADRVVEARDRYLAVRPQGMMVMGRDDDRITESERAWQAFAEAERELRRIVKGE